MKISISNFKSITRLNEFPIKPMTILSGTNSIGKSSFIQFLLLIKQTLELDSSNFQLVLNGDSYEVREFIDLLRGKTYKNKLEAEFIFDKHELSTLPTRLEIFDKIEYTCRVELAYEQYKDKPYISDFIIRYLLEGDQKKEGQFVRFSSTYGRNEKYNIQTNNELFVKSIWNANPKITKITYSGIYPTSYDILEISIAESPTGEKLKDEKLTRYFSNIDFVKARIDAFFNDISYIGPSRETPKDAYAIKGRHKTVGAQGQFVAEILESRKGEIIEIFKPVFNEDGVSYSLEKMTLLKAVSFWMCDVFKLGKELRSSKVEDAYSISIINSQGVETTIKHVGFGVSQILPVLVEGLVLKAGATLILEQPEIHLHPKLQSLLFDFLRSLMLKRVTIIIETHSDHFITRLRRRIAEEKDNVLPNEVNLTFIENINNEILFRTLSLDDNGTLEYFPADFMEQANIETKSILKAQLRKRSKLKK